MNWKDRIVDINLQFILELYTLLCYDCINIIYITLRVTLRRIFLMKGIITVLGKDQVGIIAKVCTYLAEDKINILDISQTIVNGYFNMMMIVDLTGCSDRVSEVIDQLANLGKEIGVDIRLQREDIFDNMHRI